MHKFYLFLLEVLKDITFISYLVTSLDLVTSTIRVAMLHNRKVVNSEIKFVFSK